MVWYCEKCQKVHKENELCPQIRLQLKHQPEFLAGAANFVEVACQERLISTQGLDYPVEVLNRITGKELAYAEILNAAGYIYGMTVNLERAYKDFMDDEQFHHTTTAIVNNKMLDFQSGMAEFQKIMKGEAIE